MVARSSRPPPSHTAPSRLLRARARQASRPLVPIPAARARLARPPLRFGARWLRRPRRVQSHRSPCAARRRARIASLRAPPSWRRGRDGSEGDGGGRRGDVDRDIDTRSRNSTTRAPASRAAGRRCARCVTSTSSRRARRSRSSRSGAQVQRSRSAGRIRVAPKPRHARRRRDRRLGVDAAAALGGSFRWSSRTRRARSTPSHTVGYAIGRALRRLRDGGPADRRGVRACSEIVKLARSWRGASAAAVGREKQRSRSRRAGGRSRRHRRGQPSRPRRLGSGDDRHLLAELRRHGTTLVLSPTTRRRRYLADHVASCTRAVVEVRPVARSSAAPTIRTPRRCSRPSRAGPRRSTRASCSRAGAAPERGAAGCPFGPLPSKVERSATTRATRAPPARRPSDACHIPAGELATCRRPVEPSEKNDDGASWATTAPLSPADGRHHDDTAAPVLAHDAPIIVLLGGSTRASAASRARRPEWTGDPMVAGQAVHGWRRVVADRSHLAWAARREGTAAQRLARARHRPLEQDARVLRSGPARDGREQRLGVRM